MSQFECPLPPNLPRSCLKPPYQVSCAAAKHHSRQYRIEASRVVAQLQANAAVDVTAAVRFVNDIPLQLKVLVQSQPDGTSVTRHSRCAHGITVCAFFFFFFSLCSLLKYANGLGVVSDAFPTAPPAIRKLFSILFVIRCVGSSALG